MHDTKAAAAESGTKKGVTFDHDACVIYHNIVT